MLIIKQVKNENVYDISVQGNHNFYANGILVHNCVEIGMYPKTEDGRSGFQFCNLVETNGAACKDKETFLRACRAAAILGTIQAGYTNFKYVSQETKEITEREALIGVSITGWMNSPKVLFDKDNMIEGAQLVMSTNKSVAKMLGINPAARTTCTKPAGSTSILLGTASGIHGEHSPQYFRHVQMNENEEILQHIRRVNPAMIEKSVWSANGTDYVVAFPITNKSDSRYKKQLQGVKQLEFVKLAQQYWVEYGTDVDLCVDKTLRHNISNTISVDDWDEVEQYIYDNRQYFAGISLLSSFGDRAYVQAPFAEVFDSKTIMKEYGEGSLFASGLIVDALHAFNQNMWLACDTVMGMGEKFDDKDDSSTLLKRDWVRRAKKYADNYFGGDTLRMTFCLKDCYNLHKWNNITRSMVDIDFAKELQAKTFIDADTLAGAACAGGNCEI